MSSLRDYARFFGQFRERFETTGSIAPSSRFLAASMVRPMSNRSQPARILEIGPGTGAVTRTIVRRLQPDDRFDLVELNETFAGMLNERFDNDPKWKAVAGQSQVHVRPIQEFEFDEPYDYVISGLPLNNFPSDLVESIFETYFKLLAPGGVLSYFEYMYVRPIRCRISNASERERLSAIDRTMRSYLDRYGFRRDNIFVNLPPAWVQHLRNSESEAAAT